MILEGLHEREIFSENYPFRLAVNTEEDFHYPLHWHNAVELAYTLEGGCRVNSNGVSYLLDEKEVLIIPSGEIHDIHSSDRNGKRVFIQFNISMLDGFGGFGGIKPFLSQALKISRHEDKAFHSAIQKCVLDIIEEYENKKFAYELSLNARIFDIIVLLSRNAANHSAVKNTGSTPEKVSGLEKINLAFKYIEENYRNEITLKDASKAAGFSEYHFSRIFKKTTEKNFHSYLNEYRIKKAEKLLMDGGIPVSRVAQEVGFNSFATFNRIFKSVKGCTPTFFMKAGI